MPPSIFNEGCKVCGAISLIIVFIVDIAIVYTM